MDYRNGADYDIYAQRVNASGSLQWTADGVALCIAAYNQDYPEITTDGVGGAIIAWRDFRNGTDYETYGQRVNASGSLQWTADGVALCIAAYNQDYPEIITDGAGGAIITWGDYRSGVEYDIYALRLLQNGCVGGGYTDPGEDIVVAPIDSVSGSAPVTLTFDSVFVGGVTELVISQQGPPPPSGFKMCSPPQYYDLTTTAEFSGMVEVCIDYSGQACGNEENLVLFHREDSKWEKYPAVVDTVENLVCAEVPSLSEFIIAQVSQVGLDILPGSCPNPFNVVWLRSLHEGEDKKHAGASKGGVLPVAVVGSEELDVCKVDVSTVLLEGIPPLRYGYEDVTRPVLGGDGVCACTVEGPDGYTDLTLKFSRQAVAGVFGDVEDADVVVLKVTGLLVDGTSFEGSDCVVINGTYRALPPVGGGEPRLGPVVPNPFNPITRITFSVEQGGPVNLRIFDVNGRLVRVLVDAWLEPRQYEAVWDGTDRRGKQVASGVYFYRLDAPGWRETKKMTLAR